MLEALGNSRCSMLRKITILAVFLFCLSVPAFATDITISSTQIRYWDGPTSGVELRLNLDQSIVTPQQQNFPANAVVVKVACTVAPETVNGVTQYILIIPTIVIPATRDALVGRTARYTARFYRTGTNTVIKAWGGYESFALASTPTTTTWGAVALSNQNGGPPVLGDNVAYSRDETRSLLNSIGGYTNSTAFTIGAATSPAAGNFDIRAGSGNNVPTVRYSSGAGCWQSSTDGVSFTCLGAGSGSGTVSAGTTNQLAYYSINGTTVQGLGLGAGLSIGGGTLNVTFPTASGLQQAINAKTDFGCVANGSTDDTSCLTNAIAAGLASTGKKVQLPAGNYRVTGITVPGGVTLEGDGMRKTIISSVTNGIIVNAVEGSGFYQFTGPTIRNLMIQGSKTAGGSQIGLKADDIVGPDLYYAQALFENIQISQAGSHGFYAGNTFSHRAINIYSDDNAGYPFVINSANMPSNHYESLYAQGTNAGANAGFRILAGNFICISCNGINQSAAGSWNAILGQSIAQGDAANVSAFAQWQNTNFESAKAGGIDHRYNSVSTFSGHNQFAGDAASSGSYIAMRYEITTGIFPPFFGKGTIDSSTVFANSPASFYANSLPIHANDLPPLSISGQGPGIAGGAKQTAYRNTTSGTDQQLYRSDAYFPIVSVTTSTVFANPGPRYFEVTCVSNCALTLPWPGWYQPASEQIVVKNLSATAIVITINAASGGTVNGAGSYTMSTQYDSVTLMPSSTALDYRVVATTENASTPDALAVNSSDYGALCNNSANDTAALVAAISAAQVAGKALNIQPGTCLTDPITANLQRLTIKGAGRGRSMLKARVANNPVFNLTTAGYANGLVLQDLTIQGRGKTSGSSGHCIYINDSTGYLAESNFSRLEIKDCGGKGIYIPTVFSATFDTISTDEIGDNHFDLAAGNTVTLINNYVHTVEAGKVGYRITGGQANFIGNNGMDPDSGLTARWGLFGSEIAEDGIDSYFRGTLYGNNIEDFGDVGLELKVGSFASFTGNAWSTARTGNHVAVKFRYVDAALGFFDTGSNRLNPPSVGAWLNSWPIHSWNTPFFVLGEDSQLTSYYDTAATVARTLPSFTVSNGIPPPTRAFASLGTPANGVIYYCSDCVKGGNPCAGAGTGAIAQRLNSVWRCD